VVQVVNVESQQCLKSVEYFYYAITQMLLFSLNINWDSDTTRTSKFSLEAESFVVDMLNNRLKLFS